MVQRIVGEEESRIEQISEGNENVGHHVDNEGQGAGLRQVQA